MPLPALHRRTVQAVDKTYQPIASVAALSERLVQENSAAGGHWCTTAPPDVSLRGAKRRGNLAVPGRITGKPSAKTQLLSRDCTPRALPRASRSGRHVGLRPPRNDKSVCLAPLNYCCNTRNCLRRSGSAATDAIGAHHVNDSLHQFAGAAPSVAHPRIHAKTGADGVRSRLLCSFTDCCAASSSGAFWLRDPVHACGCAGSAA